MLISVGLASVFPASVYHEGSANVELPSINRTPTALAASRNVQRQNTFDTAVRTGPVEQHISQE